MNEQDPLSQLRDIHLSDPIGWWPLAPGWWILITLTIILIIISAIYIIRKVRPTALELYVKDQINRLKKETINKETLSIALQLMRRVAIKKLPSEQVASINYQALATVVSNHTSLTFSESSMELFSGLQYRKTIDISPNHWTLFLQELELVLVELTHDNKRKRNKLTVTSKLTHKKITKHDPLHKAIAEQTHRINKEAPNA